MTRKLKMELLAPAGGRESLLAAVRCGADAVYLGGTALNARRNAENFDADAMKEAVSYCHIRGVKVYLALNTLVFDNELDTMLAALEQACEAKVDAVIIQDLAAAEAVKRCAPGLRLHASTQMSIHNLDGARQLEEMGFCRVVLAREMEAEEIRRVAQGTSLEVECFVHGALCMCVSGQCALSSMIGGRSGNRGMCAQPCRLPFSAGGGSHALSLRDLSLVEQIPLLGELGVASLKIEGRMKRPEYVAGAVSACRSMLDGRTADLQSLEAVFSRTGFTDGYFTGKRDRGMFGTRQKEDVLAAGPVLKKLQGLYRGEAQRVPVHFSLRVQGGEPVELVVADDDGNRVALQGESPVKAASAPTTAGRAAGMLNKTGGTPYDPRETLCDIQDGLLVPASALNALRRQALEELSALRERRTQPVFSADPAWKELAPHNCPDGQQLRVRLHRHWQMTDGIREQAGKIVLPVPELLKLPPQVCGELGGRLMAEIPRLLFDEEERLCGQLEKVREAGVSGAVAGNLGGLLLAKRLGFSLHGDFGLNIANSVALEQYRKLGLQDATVSFELEREKVQALRGEIPRGILAYGNLPLMAMRNCPVRASLGCEKCGHSFPELTDRMGNRFPVDCAWGTATLYNCVPLYLGDRLREFDQVDFFTLYFTRETPSQCDAVVRLYKNGGALDGEKTRGLYYRKVL